MPDLLRALRGAFPGALEPDASVRAQLAQLGQTGVRYGHVSLASAINYLLLDRFTTDRAAPLPSPRSCEPGPGTLTISDPASVLSISGEKFYVNGTPAQDSGFYSPQFARQVGRLLLAALR